MGIHASLREFKACLVIFLIVLASLLGTVLAHKGSTGAVDMEWWKEKALTDSFRRHFVALSGKYILLDDKGEQSGSDVNFVFSAFIVEICGEWWLATAGHIVTQLDELIKHNKSKLLRCGLGDYFNTHAKVKEPHPFPYAETNKVFVDQEGVDIALIPLRYLFRESLRANGIKPMPVTNWTTLSDQGLEAFCVMGTPEENMTRIEPSSSRGSGTSVLLAVIPLEPCPIPAERKTHKAPRFAARLLDGGELSSAKGFSGGPIIGIRRTEDGGWEYACIAVQASWDAETRMVFGTPVSIAVQVIERMFGTTTSQVEKGAISPTR